VIRFRFVDEHRGAYGVKRICRVLGIDRSSYYDHLARAEAREAKVLAEDEPAAEIAEIHAASGGAYGAIRVTRGLRARGRVVNKKRVARIMKERGIAGITRRKRKSLTKADKKAPPAPDLIRRDFTAVMPGIRLVGDITYLPTSEGRLYLATVIDLCTREVVGWSWPTTCAQVSSSTRSGWRTPPAASRATRSSIPIAGRNTRRRSSATS
jgi:transposase InsO family protein